jgi:hypothetical protein
MSWRRDRQRPSKDFCNSDPGFQKKNLEIRRESLPVDVSGGLFKYGILN